MNALNGADTAFVLMCTALVMLMTPGLALFYGGMVRSKNVLGTVMQSFFMVGVASIIWALVGYSLAFGPDLGHVIGGLQWAGLAGVGLAPEAAYAPTVPALAFMAFQLMFAVITPALITGAFAERMKFSGFLLFTILWCVLVYAPVAHWVWGSGGWLRQLGVLDFAGGIVVHVNAAAAALAAVLVIGKRRDFGSDSLTPHNLTMTVFGAGLLWFGWFGFNAGSALSAGPLAVSAFVATHLAAAAGRDVPDYATAIDRLAELGVVSADFAGRFRAIAGFRNVLVHGYLEVDLGVVEGVLAGHLDDFRSFALDVERHLAQQGG